MKEIKMLLENFLETEVDKWITYHGNSPCNPGCSLVFVTCPPSNIIGKLQIYEIVFALSSLRPNAKGPDLQ